MKNYEFELVEVFKELKKNAVVSFKDFDELILKMEKCAMKISCQRVELEISRDKWKKRYEDKK